MWEADVEGRRQQAGERPGQDGEQGRKIGIEARNNRARGDRGAERKAPVNREIGEIEDPKG